MQPIPGMYGSSVETVQWESGNRYSRFPFSDDSGPDGYPFDVVCDACVIVPSEMYPSTEPVYVGCLHISSSMVSAMLYCGGRPILQCMVTSSSFEPFSPIKLEPVDSSCSGFIAFGDIQFSSFRTPVTIRDMVPLSESAIVRPVVGRLRKFIQPSRVEEASGIVGIVVPDGVGMEKSEDGHVSTISFSLSDPAMDDVLVSCDVSKPEEGKPSPVYTINGVSPDENGRIAIVFTKSPDEVQP